MTHPDFVYDRLVKTVTRKTIAEIADARALKSSTIESHLAYYIFEGKVKVEELVPTAKIVHITKAIQLHSDQALAPVKNELGDDFTYGEIRAVVNHLQWEKQKITIQ